jgi:hypothetical protein
MTQTQFNELHVSYVSAFRDYVTSAEQTAAMLAHCTPNPLSLIDRLRLVVQERSETQAYSAYLDLKSVLHEAARSGYQSSN